MIIFRFKTLYCTMKLLTVLAAFLIICSTCWAADSVIDDNLSVVSTYNAEDVRNFREDLFSQLEHLQNTLVRLELDFTSITVCIAKTPIWFPAIPVWLEGDTLMTDRLGAVVVKSLDEVETITGYLDQAAIATAIRRIDLLPYRLEIDGLRYRRRIAKRFQGIFRSRDLLV